MFIRQVTSRWLVMLNCSDVARHIQPFTDARLLCAHVLENQTDINERGGVGAGRIPVLQRQTCRSGRIVPDTVRELDCKMSVGNLGPRIHTPAEEPDFVAFRPAG